MAESTAEPHPVVVWDSWLRLGPDNIHARVTVNLEAGATVEAFVRERLARYGPHKIPSSGFYPMTYIHPNLMSYIMSGRIEVVEVRHDPVV